MTDTATIREFARTARLIFSLQYFDERGARATGTPRLGREIGIPSFAALLEGRTRRVRSPPCMTELDRPWPMGYSLDESWSWEYASRSVY